MDQRSRGQGKRGKRVDSPAPISACISPEFRTRRAATGRYLSAVDGVDDDALALRLEGAWPLLEAARLQYRAVVVVLQAWGWRARLRRMADVAREVARRDDEVARHLERALRRAEVEAWPRGRVTRTLNELAAHRATLVELLAGEPGTALRELLRDVLLAPRRVPAAEVAPVATLALRLEPGLLPALEALGRTLEPIFSRPAQPLPFTRAEYETLRAQWPRGEQALRQAWHELERVDTSGALAAELRLRATYAPRGAPRGPVEVLLHAAFWKATAEARLEVVLETRFAPARVQPSEAASAIDYLLARRDGGAARLEGPRGALLMLAHEFAGGHRSALPGGRATLRAWASAADERRDDPDWQRVSASLGASSVQRLLEGPRTLPRAPERLGELFCASDEP